VRRIDSCLIAILLSILFSAVIAEASERSFEEDLQKGLLQSRAIVKKVIEWSGPPHFLYNFVGSGGSVATSGGSSVAGILLASERGIALSSSTVIGEIISGGSGIAFSGTTQVNNTGP
jgi:hypothetical protein